MLVIALFTRHVFQSDEAWANALLFGSALFITSAVGLSVMEGDWGGYYPLRSAGYWLEWVGLLVPFVWLGFASLVHYLLLRRHARLGSVDPLVCNRFLLWGLFGILQLCSFFLMSWLYIIYESQYRWTAATDFMLAASDLLAIAIAFLAFFPPTSYRNWIRGAALSHDLREG